MSMIWLVSFDTSLGCWIQMTLISCQHIIKPLALGRALVCYLLLLTTIISRRRIRIKSASNSMDTNIGRRVLRAFYCSLQSQWVPYGSRIWKIRVRLPPTVHPMKLDLAVFPLNAPRKLASSPPTSCFTQDRMLYILLKLNKTAALFLVSTKLRF